MTATKWWARLIRLATLLSWAIWFGGLTVYAGLVVPIASQQIGETTQGFVTQQVTIRLNWLCLISIIGFVAHEVLLRKNRIASFVVAALQMTFLIGLMLLHPKLTSMLDMADRSGPLDSGFYQWHQAYLLLTTVQWLNGLVMLVLLNRAFADRPQSDQSPTE